MIIVSRFGAKRKRWASSSNRRAGRRREVQRASSIPQSPPATEIATLSASTSRTSSRRPAPIAMRSEVSCERANARPSKKEITFAQAMEKTAPAANASSVPMRERPAAISGVMPVPELTGIASPRMNPYTETSLPIPKAMVSRSAIVSAGVLRNFRAEYLRWKRIPVKHYMRCKRRTD